MAALQLPSRREVAASIPALTLAYPMLIWPLYFTAFTGATGLSSRLSNLDASQSNSLNIVYLLAVGALAMWATLPGLRYGARIAWSPAQISVLVYLLLAAMSVFWALNGPISFRRLIQQYIIVFSALFAGLAADVRQIVDRLTILMVVVVAVNIVWLGVKPPSPIGVEGIYPQKNVLGAAMIVAVPLLLHGAWVADGWRRLVVGGTLLGALGLLLLSNSKTSLGLVVIVPLFAFLVIATAMIVRASVGGAFLFFLGILGFAGFITFGLLDVSMEQVSLFLFGDATFTGRTFIWEFVGQKLAQRPLLGYGFNSFWGIGYQSPSFQEAPGFIVSILQAHNGYLDVRAETGLVGLALLFAIIVTGVRQACRKAETDPALGWLSLTLILTAVLHNSMESSFFRGFSLMWMTYLIAVCISSPPLRALDPAKPALPPAETGDSTAAAT